MLIINNVVTKDTMRQIQSKTLKELSDILVNSFGPNGSNACIKKENALSRYTKDGHTIIGALHYNGIIEQSIKDDVESITRHIVKTVGDGTTSAVILSSLILEAVINLENEGYNPTHIARTFETVVKEVSEAIKLSAGELSLQDVYDIAMISTNGNEFVSNTLKDIYAEFGNSVFIDVTPSTGEEFIVKSYNGMTLNSGFANSCYITDTKKNAAEVPNPEVYFFEHPVDTQEMAVYLDSIISRNIIVPFNTQQWDQMIPTVIFAPTISQDLCGTIDSLVSVMEQMPANNKLPICLIVNLHEPEQLADLARMCGAKMIRKYIDAKIYKQDVEKGVAPTPDTIFNWAGSCDKVVSYSDKTTFIRPHKMYNEDGSYSELYNNLVGFLESEISINVADGGDIREVGTLKRRLHSLKSNMVELFVGGITQADRDAVRDLVEDAVLNIRSAAENGVGLGANMSAAIAIRNMANSARTVANEQSVGITKPWSLFDKILFELEGAYINLVEILYTGTEVDIETSKNEDVTMSSFDTLYNHYITNGTLYNIRENIWTTNVKTSIRSDMTILDTVSKIITIMGTCNQFIVPSAAHNIYMDK